MFKSSTTLVSAFAILLSLSSNLSANDLNSKNGTLHHVNFKTYTLSIVNEQGKVEEFTFSPATKTVVDGKRMKQRSVLKPGQQVEVKFRAKVLEQAAL